VDYYTIAAHHYRRYLRCPDLQHPARAAPQDNGPAGRRGLGKAHRRIESISRQRSFPEPIRRCGSSHAATANSRKQPALRESSCHRSRGILPGRQSLRARLQTRSRDPPNPHTRASRPTMEAARSCRGRTVLAKLGAQTVRGLPGHIPLIRETIGRRDEGCRLQRKTDAERADRRST
jgi:hypothetical protein